MRTEVVGSQDLQPLHPVLELQPLPRGSSQIGVNTNSSSSGAAVIPDPAGDRPLRCGGRVPGGPHDGAPLVLDPVHSGPWIALAGNPLATNVCLL